MKRNIKSPFEDPIDENHDFEEEVPITDINPTRSSSTIPVG